MPPPADALPYVVLAAGAGGLTCVLVGVCVWTLAAWRRAILRAEHLTALREQDVLLAPERDARRDIHTAELLRETLGAALLATEDEVVRRVGAALADQGTQLRASIQLYNHQMLRDATTAIAQGVVGMTDETERRVAALLLRERDTTPQVPPSPSPATGDEDDPPPTSPGPPPGGDAPRSRPTAGGGGGGGKRGRPPRHVM